MCYLSLIVCLCCLLSETGLIIIIYIIFQEAQHLCDCNVSELKTKLHIVKSSSLHQLIQPGLVNIPLNTSVIYCGFIACRQLISLFFISRWNYKFWDICLRDFSHHVNHAKVNGIFFVWCPQHWSLWIIHGPYCEQFSLEIVLRSIQSSICWNEYFSSSMSSNAAWH